MKRYLIYKIYKCVIQYFVGLLRYHQTYIYYAFTIIKNHFLDNKLHIKIHEYSKIDPFIYAATPYYILEKIVDYLKPKPEDILIDFGCGEGRVVFFMALQGFKKVIGVEIKAEILNIANENHQNIKPDSSPIELINTDATTYRITDENMFFMANPFDEQTFKKIINNIKDSLVVNPREIHIIYYWPVHRYLLDNQDWLVLEKSVNNNLCLIWRNLH